MTPARSPRSSRAGLLAAAWAVSFLLASPAGAGPLFRAPFRAYAPLGSGTSDAAIADFDGDGALDVAVVSRGTNSVAILLNRGSGDFRPPTFLTSLDYAFSIEAGDLNGDGRPDLVVCHLYGSAVSVFLGAGNGTFGSRADYPTGSDSRGVTIGDVNRDGIRDLVVANTDAFSGRSISVLLGNGDGTFQPKLDTAMDGVSPSSVAIADFNEDGWPDLVTGYEGGATAVYVMFGLGGGRFGPIHGIDSGYNPITVATGDVNGDGHQDFIVGGAWSYDVTVHLGRGDGTFGRTSMPIPGSAWVALADLDRDGRLDILSPGAVMRGHGDGAFDAPVSFMSDFDASTVAVGDLDGDGRLDLVTADQVPGTVSMITGRGDGTFDQPAPFATVTYPQAVAAGDVNGDGRVDVAVGSYGLAIHLGSGDGGFSSRSDVGGGDFYPVAVEFADLNRDGALDIVTTSFQTVSTLLGAGNGTFGTRRDFPVGPGSRSVATGDFNRDGRPDVVAANWGTYGGHRGATFIPGTTVSILLGQGDGTLAPRVDVECGTAPYRLLVTDINRDGNQDVLVVNSSSDLGVLLGNGDGSFRPRRNYPTGAAPNGLVLGDFNADGMTDVATANAGSRSVSILLGNGDGSFGANTEFGSFGLLKWIGTGDWNGDGKPDLATVEDNANTVRILLGQGNATFVPAGFYGVGSGPIYGEVADLNADGRPDIVTANYYGASFSTLVNLGETPTATLLALVSAEVRSTGVRLTWSGSFPRGAAIEAERRSSEGAWRTVVEPRVQGDRVVLDDDTVSPGGRYAYRLRVGPGGEQLTAETWVEIPSSSPLALYGWSGKGAMKRIAFSLASAGAASLDIYDSAGRRVFRTVLEPLGAGRHEVELTAASVWRPGIYFARIAQGSRSARAKLCVLW